MRIQKSKITPVLAAITAVIVLAVLFKEGNLGRSLVIINDAYGIEAVDNVIQSLSCLNPLMLEDEEALASCAQAMKAKDDLITLKAMPANHHLLTSSLSSNPNNKYHETTHVSLLVLALKPYIKSEKRIKNISDAAALPDKHIHISDLLRHPWGHLYSYCFWGKWCWGGADYHFEENLEGAQNSNGISRHSADGFSAKYYYERNDQQKGDWYLGYALHFIEDATILVHASMATIWRFDLITKHDAFEKWIAKNYTQGINFNSRIKDDNIVYEIKNPAQDLRAAAASMSYWKSDLARKVWDSYISNGYPREVGEGNEELIEATTMMLKNTLRYTKGAVKFALEKFNQTTSSY